MKSKTGKIRRKRPKLWHIAVAIPVICGVGGWIWTAILERRAMAEVRREVAKLQALGIPTTPEEMTRRVAPENNAAPIYEQAIAAYRAAGPEKFLYLRSAMTKPQAKQEYIDYINGNGETLNCLVRAALRPDCEWNRKWALGANLSFPEFSEMKSFSRLVASKAYLESGRGNYAKAVDWLIVGKKISIHCREPVILGLLNSIASENIVQTEFQKQMGEHGHSEVFRREAKRFNASSSRLPSIRDGLKGEVLGVRSYVTMLGQGDPDIISAFMFQEGGLKGKAMMYSYRFPFIRAAIEARSLKEIRTTIEAIGDGSDLRHQAKAMADFDQRIASDESFFGHMVAIFFPGLARTGQFVQKVEAVRMISNLGLQIWDTRAKLGAFPAKFDTGQDPYTGAAFVYKKTATGFRLYCVGPNGIDDGGTNNSRWPRIDDTEFGFPNK